MTRSDQSNSRGWAIEQAVLETADALGKITAALGLVALVSERHGVTDQGGIREDATPFAGPLIRAGSELERAAKQANIALRELGPVRGIG